MLQRTFLISISVPLMVSSDFDFYSVIIPAQPKPPLCTNILPQPLDHLIGALRLDQYPLVVLPHKAAPHGVPHPIEQPIPITLYVEDHNGHGVDPELVPSCDLHKLFHGAIATREGNEAAAGSTSNDFAGHQLLAGVHILHDGGTAVNEWVDLVAGIGRVV